jgi:hypothetical protein
MHVQPTRKNPLQPTISDLYNAVLPLTQAHAAAAQQGTAPKRQCQPQLQGRAVEVVLIMAGLQQLHVPVLRYASSAASQYDGISDGH